MSGTPLPRARPAAQGVDARAVERLLDALEAHPDIEMHSLMVLRGGHVVAEGWWSPYRPEHRQQIYSLSKNFAITAVGLAQAEGLLHLDDPVLSHFPELADEVAHPRTAAMTLRHLAHMASGHGREMLDEALERDAMEPVRGFLMVPPEEEPGSVNAYSQPCTYTLAAVVQRQAGQTLLDYLRPRLLDPLGIGDLAWSAWPPGRHLGFSGLHARTEDVAKLGLLHLQEGLWEGRRLLPREWVAEATEPRIASRNDRDEPDWALGYGLHFWKGRHGYRGDGAYGQFCLVLPEQDAVVVTTARTEEMQAVLDAMWTHLVPGLGADEVDLEADERLATRLAGLELAPTTGVGPQPSQPCPPGPFPVETVGETGRSTAPLRDVAVDAEQQQVRLLESENALTVDYAPDAWTVTNPRDRTGAPVPVAASGGWADGALTVSVLFLETPHRLELRVTPEDGRAVASWPAAPLAGTAIDQLRCP